MTSIFKVCIAKGGKPEIVFNEVVVKHFYSEAEDFLNKVDMKKIEEVIDDVGLRLSEGDLSKIKIS